MERQADPEAIAYIRQVMGGHAQLIINSLLVADAFITAYRVIMKPMVFLSDDVEVKEKHAFDVMCAMIDYTARFWSAWPSAATSHGTHILGSTVGRNGFSIGATFGPCT